MANTFTSPRLTYRALEPDDEPFLTTLSTDTQSHLNATPFLPTPPSAKSAKESKEWLEKCLLGVLICLPPPPSSSSTTPTPIGFISLNGPPPNQQHHRRASIGLAIQRDYQGMGYGSEAIQWVLRWAFEMANLHRVEIGAFGYNERAAALYERLGFKREGRRREFLWFSGRYWDLMELGMLREEWVGLYGGEEGGEGGRGIPLSDR